MFQFLFLFFLTVLVAPITGTPPKNGFYRISDASDGEYLTATRQKGRPHPVIVSEWKSLPTQEWKVKTEQTESGPLQIIRNELIRDNEVTKEINEEKQPGEQDFKQIDYNIYPSEGADGYYEITNGATCLESTGKGQRITLEEECNNSKPGQQWKFEFLYAIPPPKHTADD